MTKVRVYLDTNVWCRPYDAPSFKVDREKDALYKILEKIGAGEIEILGSVVLEEEVKEIKQSAKRDAVEKSINRLASENIDFLPKIYGEVMEKAKLKVKDAAHIACALEGNATYFISVDAEILSKAKDIESAFGIKVRNPIEFLEG